MIHIEFTVPGPPVSHQSSNKASLKRWRKIVRKEARLRWRPKPLLKCRLKCVILNFHEGESASLDDDNMVKPIRDALNKTVYEDDSQIVYSETVQSSIDAPVVARSVSLVILTAYSRGSPFVYVRIEDAPTLITLPK